ncbi:hypothetical protein NL676_030401 [Syzygium grande]|nr:hypothetical protein NL676_030401 [Syzygium grande]
MGSSSKASSCADGKKFDDVSSQKSRNGVKIVKILHPHPFVITDAEDFVSVWNWEHRGSSFHSPRVLPCVDAYGDQGSSGSLGDFETEPVPTAELPGDGFLTSPDDLAAGDGCLAVEPTPVPSDLGDYGFDLEDFLNLFEDLMAAAMVY